MITLLNNEKIEESVLKEKMIDDSYYYGHLGKYALSSSACTNLLKSPKTYRNIAKYGSKDTPALLMGRMVHWAILEPDKLEAINVVDASARSTVKYKEAVKKYGHEKVMLRKEMSEIERLADALLRNEGVLQALSNSDFEVSECAMLEGLPFRGKADILKKDTSCIIDLKTTSSDLSTFNFSANTWNYDLQAYIYTTMFKAKDIKFVVIDKRSTDIGIFETTEEFLEKGKEKFDRAIKEYKYWFLENRDLDQYVFRGIL
tara:strand:- start:433 stop:1209 length:777 start_codon:yes stop_codon:yes gene_type:complete